MELPRNVTPNAPPEPGVVASSVYSAGRRVADIPIEEAGAWAGRDGHFVWIGLREPDRELLLRVQRQFALHDLAIEDAEHPHQRPKLELYGDALFIVARTAQLIEGRVTFGETHLFVGAGYIVSVRHGPSTSYTAVRQHWESCPSALAKGEDFILYAILDFIVDNYMPVLETIEDEVDEIEDRVLVRPMTAVDIERLYMLRRDLLRLRNAAGPLVEVCRRLTSADLPQIRRPCTRCSATSPTTSAPSRRRSTICARCWLSPSRPACWSARVRKPRSPRSSPPGPPFSRFRLRWRAFTA